MILTDGLTDFHGHIHFFNEQTGISIFRMILRYGYSLVTDLKTSHLFCLLFHDFLKIIDPENILIYGFAIDYGIFSNDRVDIHFRHRHEMKNIGYRRFVCL